MSQFTGIDLSKLPDPELVGSADFETIFSQLKADFIAEFPDAAETLELESEPLTVSLQLLAYRELHIRQQANDFGLSLMLAKATGANLDNLGALPFINLSRKVLQEADDTVVPPVPEIRESDEELRTRMQMAMEGYSTAGSAGGYIFHALGAHQEIKDAAVAAPEFETYTPPDDTAAINTLPADVKLIRVLDAVGMDSPMPGDVAVTLLGRNGNGTPSGEAVAIVDSALNEERIRPITDHPYVRGAGVIEYQIEATLTFLPGPDPAVPLAAAQQAVDVLVAELHSIGRDVELSAIYAALHQSGVAAVNLTQPTARVECNRWQVAYCTGITITDGGLADG